MTVYDRPAEPLLVAYRAGGCVLAVVAIERDRFRRALRDGPGDVA